MKSHINNLEAESIYIIREALAESKNVLKISKARLQEIINEEIISYRNNKR